MWSCSQKYFFCLFIGGSPLPNQVPDAIVPLPPVPQPQPAGYIGASGPRIADRKLPERYYGGPEVSQRQTGQKYNFLQKMAKLSMDAKEQQSQTNTSMNLSNRCINVIIFN